MSGSSLALSLFVFRILTDDPNHAFSFDNLALLAHRFHRRSDLHRILLSVWKKQSYITIMQKIPAQERELL